MQSMFTRILSIHHRRTSRSTSVTDRRSGVPARHRPDPMPRIRWYG
jgi:hypothetical protein